MRDHKNTKKMNFGINRNVMTLIGLLLLALGAMGRGIIQTRFLGVGAVNSDQLLEVLNASGGMQAAAAALVFEGLESCAAPIFAVLLIDGFQKRILRCSNLRSPAHRWLPEKLQRTEIHPSRPWSCNPQRNPIQLRLFRQIAGHDLTKSGMGNGALPSDALPLPPVRRKAGGQAPDQTGRSCGRNPLVPAVSRTVWSDHAPAGHGPLGPPQSPIPQTLFWCRSRSLLLRSESTLHVFSLRIPDRTLL